MSILTNAHQTHVGMDSVAIESMGLSAPVMMVILGRDVSEVNK